MNRGVAWVITMTEAITTGVTPHHLKGDPVTALHQAADAHSGRSGTTDSTSEGSSLRMSRCVGECWVGVVFVG
jgi:hypothetical protein